MAKRYFVTWGELEKIYKTQFFKGEKGGLWGLAYFEWLLDMVQKGVVENSGLGIYEVSKLDYKPTIKLWSTTDNVFKVMGVAYEKLRIVGKEEKAEEMFHKVTSQAEDYDEALLIIKEYVEVKVDGTD